MYGNEQRFKATIARHIASGEELADLANAVRRRTSVSQGEANGLIAYAAKSDWCSSVERWRRRVWDSLERHLADQAVAVMPTITEPWPPDTGKPRHARTMDWVEPWLTESIGELRSFLNVLGVKRNLAPTASRTGRFQELRASGLVDETVINDSAGEMGEPTTPRQLSNAIGAAKELTEATLRACLDRLGVQWANDDAVQSLMRRWREAIRTVAAPDAAAQDSLDKAQAALGNVVNFLGEWRNEYGRGHGRSRYPQGLRARHARLAVDAAETTIRFVVMTMDDLGRLPPR